MSVKKLGLALFAALAAGCAFAQQTVISTETTLGVLSITSETGPIPVFVNQTGAFGGIYGLNTNGASAFSGLAALDTLLNAGSDATGNWFLGSTGQGTYTNTLLSPAADGFHRLGGGGGTITFTQTNVLSSATGALIGSGKTNGTGTVEFLSQQAYSGNMAVASNSTLKFAGRGDATNMNSTLILTPNAAITGGGRLLVETRQAFGAYAAMEMRGITNFAGTLELTGPAGNCNKLLIDNAAAIPAAVGKIIVNTNTTLFARNSLTAPLFIGGVGNGEGYGALRASAYVYGPVILTQSAVIAPNVPASDPIYFYGGVSAAGSGTNTLTLTIPANGNNAQFSGVLSNGTAVLRVENKMPAANKITLAADNTFSGGLANDGTLQIGVGGTAGSAGSGAVANAGTIIFSHSGEKSLSSLFTGSGTLIGNGPGKTSLDNTNNAFQGSFQVRSGVLRYTSDQDLNAYVVSTTTTGALEKAGAGALTLRSQVPVTGNVAVCAGTLRSGGKIKVPDAPLVYSLTVGTVQNDGSLTADTVCGRDGPALFADGGPRAGLGRAVFGGTSNEYIEIKAAKLPNFGGTTNYSIAMWLRPRKAGGAYLYKGSMSSWLANSETFYLGNVTSDGTKGDIGKGWKVGGVQNTSGWIAGQTALPSNQWSFITLIRTNNVTTFYVNGVADGTGTKMHVAEYAGNNPQIIRIGWNVMQNLPDADYFLGDISGICLYDTALSSAQVADLMAGNLTVTKTFGQIADTSSVRVDKGAVLDLNGLSLSNVDLKGDGTILGGNEIRLNATNSDTFVTAAISGTGTVAKTGSGTVVLASQAISSGQFDVREGTLRLFGNSTVELPAVGCSFSNGVPTYIGTQTVTMAAGPVPPVYAADGPLPNLGRASFVGTNAQTYIEFSASKLPDLGGSANYTVAAWIKPVRAGSTWLYKGSIANWTYASEMFYLANTASADGFVNPGNGWKVAGVQCASGWTSAKTDLQQGQWAFVAAVRTNNVTTYYRNGIADGSATKMQLVEEGTQVIRVGWKVPQNTDGDFFEGDIGGVYIYQKALSSDQIKTLTLQLPGQTATYGRLAANSTVSVASGAVLDLSGLEQTIASLTGSGTVSNGTLILTGPIYPGGTNAVGQLTFSAVRFEGAQLMADVRDGSADRILLTGTGATALSGLTVVPVLPTGANASGVYVVAETAGTFTGHPVVSVAKWTCTLSSDGKQLRLLAKRGTLLRVY